MYNIRTYNDGIRSKYGDENNLSLAEAIESLMYYDDISSKWTEEEVEKRLNDMKIGFQHYIMFGTGFVQYKVERIS